MSKEGSFDAPSIHKVIATLDLDGDGKLECVVGSNYYEGEEITIYRYDPKKVDLYFLSLAMPDSRLASSRISAGEMKRLRASSSALQACATARRLRPHRASPLRVVAPSATAWPRNSDGKIVVAGYCRQSSGVDQFALVRYNSDGSLDTSLNSNGTSDNCGRRQVPAKGEGVALQEDRENCCRRTFV